MTEKPFIENFAINIPESIENIIAIHAKNNDGNKIEKINFIRFTISIIRRINKFFRYFL